ncbi:MAG TPA: SCP2 sterol-binding domain-containing protein [Steroidobacteraceae bacterium]|jgi:ubiquinone biosynthesis protein UbiJ|nr:SCP2 sterol-binding domain-containing protein [Steroidobacteraceae bacterium]
MLLASIEKILNRSLPRSPRAQALAASLAGRSLAVEITGTGPVVISSTGACLRIERGSQQPADARISAGPFSLLALAGGGAQALSRSGAAISGDGEVAQQFSELLGLLKPEPEEELAQLIGDAPAHHLGRLARRAFGFGERALRTSMNNVAEYLAHERRELVPKAEGRQLLDGIDALRDDVDRFEARLQHLEQRFERTGP